MLSRRLVLIALTCLLVTPHRTDAWGFEAHKFIADQAIALLPPPLRAFFEDRRVMFVEHSIAPDLWRNVGFEDEPPRHFLDIDAYGPYPFDALPRDYDAAVAKFGEEKVRRNGQLPWRTEEIYERLFKAFAQIKRGDAPGWAYDNVAFFASVLSHYVGDGHVPFHAVVNFDGQLTDQLGVHARFESELFSRVRPSLRVTPPVRAPITDARDAMFEVLIESTTFTQAILDADRKAIGTREYYDDEYFTAFAAGGAQAVLERRINESVAAVAAIITGAWEAAGKPDLTRPAVRPPTKRRYVKKTEPEPQS
jgi:hypothetical protein